MEFSTFCLLTICAGVTVAASEHTSVPPNCVCTALPSTTQKTSGARNGTTKLRPTDGLSDRSSNKSAHKICGNNGRNYTSKCDFVNAQATNPDLGTRSCRPPHSITKNNRLMGARHKGFGQVSSGKMAQMRGRPRAISICMTDGTTQSGAKVAMYRLTTRNPSLGIRCRHTCPCPALECPGQEGQETHANAF